MAAAAVFSSSSSSGSDLSWDIHNNDSMGDFHPQNHDSAVFCRKHTPPPKRKSASNNISERTSANDLWAEPMPSNVLPTPSPIKLSASSTAFTPTAKIVTNPTPQFKSKPKIVINLNPQAAPFFMNDNLNDKLNDLNISPIALNSPKHIHIKNNQNNNQKNNKQTNNSIFPENTLLF